MSDGTRALVALGVTLKAAGLGTLLAAGPGVLCGLVLARRRGPLRALLAALAQLPLVIPPVAIGLLLLVTLPRTLLFTWGAASLAAGVMAFPLVAHAAATAFEEVDPRLEAMAETLGMSRLEALRRVTLPLARRGLAAAVLLGFGRALGEFGATVVVAGNVPGATQTLALAIYEDVDLGRYDAALVPIAVAAAVSIASVLVAQALRGDGRARPGERAS